MGEMSEITRFLIGAGICAVGGAFWGIARKTWPDSQQLERWSLPFFVILLVAAVALIR